MLTVGVFYGGRSAEHDVSRCSAASVFQNLDRSEYNVVAVGIDTDGRFYPWVEAQPVQEEPFGTVLPIQKTGEWTINTYPRDGQLTFTETETGETVHIDIVFPAIHGTFCEDGRIQGLLEMSGVAYVGAGVIGSACGMDKDVSKRLMKEAGVPVVQWLTVRKVDWEESKDFIIEDIILEHGFPCFVKPANAGSSVGIHKIENRDEFAACVEDAFLYDNKILIERAVKGREIEFSVLGNEHPKCSQPGEIKPKDSFYSYKAKYIDSDGARLIIPAEIDNEIIEKMKDTAVSAYLALCLKGMARVDFFLEEETGVYYVNEVNTLPGFTSISMYPKLWEYSGLSYPALLDSLIDLALQSYADRMRIHTALHQNESK